MAARSEYPPRSLRDSYPWDRRRLALYVCAAIVVAAVGVLGLDQASPLRQLVESRINLHALFGLLLCGLVIARYLWIMQRSPHLQEDFRELSRHLSRIVYLMLYVVAGVSQSISLVNWIWHGDDASRVFDPSHDYHMLLLSGGIAIAMVRVFLTGCLVHRYRGQ